MTSDLHEHPGPDSSTVGTGAVPPVDLESAPGGALATLLESLELGTATDGDLVEAAAAWHRISAWAHAQLTRVAGVLSGRKSMNPSWDPAAGHPPAQACVAGDELAMRLCVSRRTGTRLVEHGRTFATTLEATGEALASGRISPVVAGKIADRLAGQPLQVALAVEDRVLPGAERRTPAQIDRDLEEALLLVDPGEAAARAARAQDGRCVHRPRVLSDGMASLTAVLPVVTAVRIDDLLQNAARAARSAGDARTLEQLRADGLRDLILHPAWTGDDAGGTSDAGGTDALDAGPGTESRATTSRVGDDPAGTVPAAVGHGGRGGDHRTEVRVTVALSTLLGQDDKPAHLSGGGPIDATAARALAEGGVWRRIVTDPVSGTVLDVGRTTYRPPRALARHVRIRDQVCARPGCPTSADSCELDHTDAFHPTDGSEPGVTADTNLGPLCHRDHRLKTDGGHVLRQTSAGHFLWITPAGKRYATVPGHNAEHRQLSPGEPPPEPQGSPPF